MAQTRGGALGGAGVGNLSFQLLQLLVLLLVHEASADGVSTPTTAVQREPVCNTADLSSVHCPADEDVEQEDIFMSQTMQVSLLQTSLTLPMTARRAPSGSLAAAADAATLSGGGAGPLPGAAPAGGDPSGVAVAGLSQVSTAVSDNSTGAREGSCPNFPPCWVRGLADCTKDYHYGMPFCCVCK